MDRLTMMPKVSLSNVIADYMPEGNGGQVRLSMAVRGKSALSSIPRIGGASCAAHVGVGVHSCCP
jgi:hypothetical protein